MTSRSHNPNQPLLPIDELEVARDTRTASPASTALEEALRGEATSIGHPHDMATGSNIVWTDSAEPVVPLEVSFQPEIIAPEAVSFVDRAMAIEAIMDYFTQENRVRGMQIMAGPIRQRYANDRTATNVYEGASRKADRKRYGYQRALDQLNATDAMRFNGQSDDQILFSRRQLQVSLESKYGPGNAYASDRKKLVKKIKASVH